MSFPNTITRNLGWIALLVRALSHPMRLLVLDEPFTGLDNASRTHFHAVLQRPMATSLPKVKQLS